MELCMSMKLLLCIYYQYIYIILQLSIKHLLCARFLAHDQYVRRLRTKILSSKWKFHTQRDKRQANQIVYEYAMKVRNTPFLFKASRMLEAS